MSSEDEKKLLARTAVKVDRSPLPGVPGGTRRPLAAVTHALEMSGSSVGGGIGSPSGGASPKPFLAKGTGLGGTCDLSISLAAAEKRKAGKGTLEKPPKAGALSPRPNPPNTQLRRYYERSDLPIIILQGAKPKLQWKVEIQRLDFHHYLPVFFSGLRELEDPFRFLAEEGVYDMLHHGGEAKVLPVIPQLIIPLKEALNTRDPKIMIKALRVLQAMVDLGDHIGQALVPYYRQLLPIMNIFISHTANLGDKIDYHQRFGRIGETIHETLQKLELRGGPDAFINIKYMIPTYESAVLG